MVQRMMTSIRCPNVVAWCGRCFGISTLIPLRVGWRSFVKSVRWLIYLGNYTQNPRSQVYRRGYDSNPLAEHEPRIMFPAVIYEHLYISTDNEKQIKVTSQLEGKHDLWKKWGRSKMQSIFIYKEPASFIRPSLFFVLWVLLTSLKT